MIQYIKGIIERVKLKWELDRLKVTEKAVLSLLIQYEGNKVKEDYLWNRFNEVINKIKEIENKLGYIK